MSVLKLKRAVIWGVLAALTACLESHTARLAGTAIPRL